MEGYNGRITDNKFWKRSNGSKDNGYGNNKGLPSTKSYCEVCGRNDVPLSYIY